jgi:hypothetical protein
VLLLLLPSLLSLPLVNLLWMEKFVEVQLSQRPSSLLLLVSSLPTHPFPAYD